MEPLTAHCNPPHGSTQDMTEPNALAHLGRVVPLLDVGTPEIWAFVPRLDCLVVRPLACDAKAMRDEISNDARDLGRHKEERGDWYGVK